MRCSLSALLVVWATCAFAQPAGLAFPTSGAAAAQPAFAEGLSWLHSFEYERALERFRDAQRLDPRFVMAYWGEAMCYHQSLWRNENVDEARRVLARLAPTPSARAALAVTDRERQYLAAVEALFGDGARPVRVRAYAERMKQIAERYPDDPDAAAFYALALLSEAARGFEDAGPHAGHDPADQLAGSDRQGEVAAVLEGVLRAHPRHPGALHYLIHAYDDPAHAERGLAAARLYPEVAPDASHALHMPAHIFVQLGLWREASASDEASYRASVDWVRETNRPITLRDHHSLSWLTYEYLQLGQISRAEATLAEIRPAAAAERETDRLKTLEATMQARIAVEAARWAHAEGPQYRNVDELFAVGLGQAARGSVANAEVARRRLAELAERQAEAPRRTLYQLMERQVAAAMRMREGRGEEAVAIMREALALDARLPPPMGPPQPLKPAPEQYGEILLALGRPEDATAQFEAALARWRNRSPSVLGLARAAAMAGDADAARRHYAALLDTWRDADPDLAGLAEARASLGAPSTAVPAPWAWAGAALAAAIVLTLAVRRRRPAGPGATRQASPQKRGGPEAAPMKRRRRRRR